MITLTFTKQELDALRAVTSEMIANRKNVVFYATKHLLSKDTLRNALTKLHADELQEVS